jgi:hypothetical protein
MRGLSKISRLREFCQRTGAGPLMVRCIAGSLLLLASAAKFSSFVDGYWLFSGMLQDDRWIEIPLIEFELLLGIWLISGVKKEWSWRVAILTFSVFAAISLYRVAAGFKSCGCFGAISTPPQLALVMDCVIVLGLLVFRPKISSDDADVGRGANRARVSGCILASFVLAVPTTVVMVSMEIAEARDIEKAGAIISDPGKWATSRFPVARFLETADDVESGLWLVLFYKEGCSACLDAKAQFEEFAEELIGKQNVPRIALIRCPPYSEETSATPKKHVIYGQLKRSLVWNGALSPPFAMLLDSGKVTALFEIERDIALLKAIWI